MTISQEYFDGFFKDFFYNFTYEKSDAEVNRCVNFISDNIDSSKTTYNSVENFLKNLFLDILQERLDDYEKEFLILQKDEKFGLFNKVHYLMPECFVTVLESCSRDKDYEKLKYTLMNFMYNIMN